jgi:hypothetical protein
MHIKNILLLSCLSVITINAIPIGKKIEQTKQELLHCNNQRKQNAKSWSGIFTNIDCNEQEQAYEKAKQEFMVPLNKIVDEGIAANRELVKNDKSFFPMSESKKEQLTQKKFLAYAAGGIKEDLIGRNNGYFEGSFYDGKTINEFCENALHRFVQSYCSLSSYPSDIIGPLDLTDTQAEETKKIMLEIVKKELQRESTQK